MTQWRRILVFAGFCLFFTAGIFIIICSESLVRGSGKIYPVTGFTLNGAPDEMMHRVLSREAPRIYTFSADIPGKALSFLKNEPADCIVYKMTGHWYSISFNGRLIGTAGSNQDDRANIWNAVHLFVIDPSLIRDHNTMTISVYGTYEIGRSSFPILITDRNESRKIMDWLELVIARIPSISAAFLMFGFLLLLFFFVQSPKQNTGLLLFGLSALLMSMTGIDYIEITDTIVPALIFKKSILMVMYTANALMSAAIYIEFRKKINLIGGIAVFLTMVILCIVCRDMTSFFTSFTRANILASINILLWFYPTALNFRKSNHAKAVFMGCIGLVFFLGYDTIRLLSTSFPVVNMTPYGVMFFSVVLILLVTFDYLNMANRAEKEAVRAKKFYEQIIMDRKELLLAKNVQKSILPAEAPHSGFWETGLIFLPMAEVSGDFYDFYSDNGELKGLSILDVSGHGVSSGLITMFARSIIFRVLRQNQRIPLGTVLQIINRQLVEEMPKSANYLSGALLRISENSIEYVNAGHPDMIIRRKQPCSAEIIDGYEKHFKGSLLGIPDAVEGCRSLRLRMKSGDAALLYSDCLIETLSQSGEMFGSERLRAVFESLSPSLSAQEQADAIFGHLTSFCGCSSFGDDLTIIVLKKNELKTAAHDGDIKHLSGYDENLP